MYAIAGEILTVRLRKQAFRSMVRQVGIGNCLTCESGSPQQEASVRVS